MQSIKFIKVKNGVKNEKPSGFLKNRSVLSKTNLFYSKTFPLLVKSRLPNWFLSSSRIHRSSLASPHAYPALGTQARPVDVGPVHRRAGTRTRRSRSRTRTSPSPTVAESLAAASRRPAVQQHKDKPAAKSCQKQGGGGRHSSISCNFCQFRSVLVDFVRYFRNINRFIVILFNFWKKILKY